MTDPAALVLVTVWLLSPFAALGVLRWLYRREVARDARVVPADDSAAEWLPEWGWPDRP